MPKEQHDDLQEELQEELDEELQEELDEEFQEEPQQQQLVAPSKKLIVNLGKFTASSEIRAKIFIQMT